MPQFVLFTHDDSTGSLSTSLMNEARRGFTNPNGCAIPVTYFTMQSFSDCDLIQGAHKSGDEIAGHTKSHPQMPNRFEGFFDEIAGQRQWLINECGLPAEDVVGHRSPYLINNPNHREALQKGGFLYDSTINEHYPNQAKIALEPDATSLNGGSRLWPYTMDYGIPQDCAWTGNQCLDTERYQGLWEVPVWVVQTDEYPINAYALDPCDGENSRAKCDPNELLKGMFDKAYNGNKAPVPLFVHSPWLSEQKNMNDVRSFIQYVTENYPDAYFVTMHQLVQWMQNPVPKDKIESWLGCSVAGGKAALANAPVAGIPSSTAALPSGLESEASNTAPSGETEATPPSASLSNNGTDSAPAPPPAPKTANAPPAEKAPSAPVEAAPDAAPEKNTIHLLFALSVALILA